MCSVGCIELVDLKDISRGRKVANSKCARIYKGDEFGNFIKTKSLLGVKSFSQVQDLDYHETTSPTTASAPVKTIAKIANGLGLRVFHFNIIQAFFQSLLEGRYAYVSLGGVVSSRVKLSSF